MKGKRGKDTLWEAFFEHEQKKDKFFISIQTKQTSRLTRITALFHCQQSTQNGFAFFKQSFQIVDAGHVAVLVTLI